MYVIKKLDGPYQGWYATPPGSHKSYTNKLQHAKTYETRVEAERNKCGNEKIKPLFEELKS